MPETCSMKKSVNDLEIWAIHCSLSDMGMYKIYINDTCV